MLRKKFLCKKYNGIYFFFFFVVFFFIGKDHEHSERIISIPNSSALIKCADVANYSNW